MIDTTRESPSSSALVTEDEQLPSACPLPRGNEVARPIRTSSGFDRPAAQAKPRDLLLERVIAKKPNKNELRTRETRELLLRAAETIFVRDGYERAELGEIARLANRTKGAIYDHFENKEDIFLALVEERTLRFRKEMEERMAGSRSKKQNIAIYREFCVSLLEDRAWGLLFLEFKLFALRHPESRDRLQKHYREILSEDPERRFTELLGVVSKGRDAVSRSAAVLALHPVIYSLILEGMLAPSMLDRRAQKIVTERIFDALLNA